MSKSPPSRVIVMQTLATLLNHCQIYAATHQRALTCLNTAINIAVQKQTTLTTMSTRSSIEMDVLSTLVANQTCAFEQAVSVFWQCWRQLNEQVQAMQKLCQLTYTWTDMDVVETDDLTGIVDVPPGRARQLIERIVQGYVQTLCQERSYLLPSITKETHVSDEHMLLDWDAVDALQQHAARWAQQPLIELSLEEQLQDQLRIYRLWQSTLH
jgi:hypothetical protein